jgi:hypothetical protein
MVPDMPPITLSEGKLTEQQAAYISDTVRGIIRTLNGKLTFGNGDNASQSGNIDGQTREYYFAAKNTDVEIPHGLGRTPIGIIVLDVTVDGAVVRGSLRGDWNSERLYLRCSADTCTALFVIV